MTFPSADSFINIHSHNKPRSSSEWVLRNAFHFLSPESIKKLPYAVSVGVHPWQLENVDWDAVLFKLHSCLQLPNVMAVGEIGLDRAIEIPMEIQHNYFRTQLAFAEKFNKPVIIHAVRTNTEFIPYLKEFKIPFIFHHFMGNQYEADQLLKYNTYFSFGKSILQPSKSIEVFKNIPNDRFFLETDTMNISMSTVYAKAAELKNMKEIDLKENVFHNFAAVFGFK